MPEGCCNAGATSSSKIASFCPLFFFVWNSSSLNSPLPIFSFFVLLKTRKKRKIGSSTLEDRFLRVYFDSYLRFFYEHLWLWNCNLIQITLVRIMTNWSDFNIKCDPANKRGKIWYIRNFNSPVKTWRDLKYKVREGGGGKVKSFNQWIIFEKYFHQFLSLSLYFVNSRNIVRIFHLLTLKTFNELKMLLSFSLSLFSHSFLFALDSSRNSFNSHEVYRRNEERFKIASSSFELILNSRF